ncbi:MAG: chemotaxis protein CheX [Thermoanaerobaculales bacterium]|nr:chemotaxis protein CheX [Thermoanaerobaculales bacterium]
MGSMFFGQYLLSKGAINREALIDAIERQRSTNLSLVELAVRDGCLDPQRAEGILTRYRTSDAGLEELCLEYGEIGQEKLDELRRIQRSDWVKIGATLVSGGHMTRDQVAKHLAAFHEVQREADQKLQADFRACSDPETVKTVVELAIFHLKRFTNGPVKLQNLGEDEGVLSDGRRRYAQKLSGDRELCIALDLPSQVATVAAQGLIGIAVEDDSEVAIDAVCECVNIIGGHACTRLEANGVRLRPQPPFSTEDIEPVGDMQSSIRARVMAGEFEVDVRVFV